LRYAQSGIPELWIFVLETDEIEVSRQPTPEGYADVQTYRRGDTMGIQELPDVRLTVDELLQ
jgi:Uma2 family endonuclease